MADELDAMLQGESDQTTPASQANTVGQGTVPGDLTQEQLPEEVEFNKLTGNTQDRIRKLVNRLREQGEELDRTRKSFYQVPPPPPSSEYNNTITPDVKDAVRKLSDVGIATDEKVQKVVDERLLQLHKDFEASRLEGKYTGGQGEPQFVREEVDDFVRSHPAYEKYSLEDVFRYKMFPDEFLSFEMQRRTNPKTGRSSTLRPTRSTMQQETLTPEYIEERLKQPDANQWYNDNVEKINDVLSKQQPQ